MSELLFDVEVLTDVVDIEIDAPVVDVDVTETVVAVITVEGPPGQQGPPGQGFPVFGEQLTGVQDGANTEFSTAGDYLAATTALFRNGLRQDAEDYTETPPTGITLIDAPADWEKLRIDYMLG